MDAVPAEPSSCSDVRFTPTASEFREFPILRLPSGDDLLHSAAHGTWPLRIRYFRPITNRAAELRVVLDELDRVGQLDVFPVLHLSEHRCPLPQPLNLLLECKPWSVAEPPKHPDTPSPCAELSVSKLTHLSACETTVSESVLPVASAEVGAHWQVLPRYGDRPFQLRTCCGISAPTPEALAGTPKPTLDPDASLEGHALSRGAWLLFAPITATIRDTQFIRDYREGLRRFLSGVLTLLHLMVVTLLAALSHIARTPSFLLVMLATARRYGRRGDGDSYLMSVPTWHPRQPWGAFRLAT